MKTKVLLIAGVMMALGLSAMAEPVSKAQALQQAQAFMSSKGIALAGDLTVTNGPKRAKASRDESSCYYVFNNGQNGGFVVVSGDDRTRDILAYSDTGTLDMNHLPENVGYMLQCYEEQINLLDTQETPVQAEKRTTYAETPSTNPVLPLLTCMWGQGEPFNNACPTVGGTKSYAGCVCAGVAQVIYFYRDRMPTKLKTTIESYTANGITLAAVPAGTPFYWSRMFDKYDGTQTSAQKSAVANFVLNVGKALGSVYGSASVGTSANFQNVKTNLTKYFGFSTNSTLYDRKEFTAEKWENMVINELEENRPVLYNGISSKDNHVFIIDGYDGRGLFHVNWGWTGDHDGYFVLSVLNPYDMNGVNASAGPDSYTVTQRAFFNLQPENGYSYTEGDVELTSTISSVSNNVVKVVYKNLTSKDGVFKCGLGYLDSDGYVTKLMENDEGEATVAASSSMGTVQFALKAADFKPQSGTTAEYQLYPIYLRSGQDEWVMCPNASSNYVKVNYKSNAITSSLVAMSPSLKASNFVFTGSTTKSVKQPVNFKLTNSGDKDYSGYVYLFASRTTTKGSSLSKVRVILPKGESYNATLSFTPGYAGTYNVWITSDASGTNVLGSTTVKILSSTATKNLRVTAVLPENLAENTKRIYSDEIKGVIRIQNNSAYNYNDNIIIWLGRQKKGSSGITFFQNNKAIYTILAGETLDIPFDFGEKPDEYFYGFGVYYADNKTPLANYLHTGYTLQDGVLFYAGDGTLTIKDLTETVTVDKNVAAVSMKGVASSITKVVPNANPNTLYIFDAGETVPKGLTGKNIVKGNTATSITLQDGYDFYSPVTFVADNITYTRVPDIGATGQGDGWQSLVVPFDVDKLMYSSYELGWFTSDDDTGKNLWVKQFSGIKGYSTVCFDYTDKIVANRPYIMAVPSNHWGEAYNLTGKKLEFKASNATVLKDASLITGSKVYNYRGTYYAKKVSNIYYLDSTGTRFVQGTATVKPFRCYFISAADGSDDDYGNMDIVTSVKGIMMPFASENEEVSVYNVSGMKVGTTKVVDGRISLDALPKGIYIINGHKFIK